MTSDGEERDETSHLDPVPPQYMAIADQIGVDVAGQLSQMVDAATREMLAKNGPSSVPVTRLGMLMGLERMKTALLHVLEKEGAPMDSIRGALGRLADTTRDSMRAIDQETNVLVAEKRLVYLK